MSTGSKKFWGIALIMAMVFGLAACGGKDDKVESGGEHRRFWLTKPASTSNTGWTWT
jgi:hypothetical protein